MTRTTQALSLVAFLILSSNLSFTLAFVLPVAKSCRQPFSTSQRATPTDSCSTTPAGGTTPTSINTMPTTKSVKDSTKAGLKDKAVFLTGATGGLGTALALQLASCGVKSLILSARQASALQQVSQECSKINGNVNVQTVVCDLSNAAQVKQVAAKVAAEMGPIDVLINNGGVSSRSTFLETDLDVDAKVMQINFLSGAAFCKAFIPGMVAHKLAGGRIIWISSVQGLVGIPNRSSYAASKFAVQGYTESIRAELYSNGVTVHTVSPGYIRTNLSNSALTGSGAAYGQTDATTAAGADPTDVAIELLDRIVTGGQQDFTIAATFSAVAAVYLRTLCPALLRFLLVKRYEKSTKEKSD